MRLQPSPDALEFATGVRGMLGRVVDADALRAAWDSADGRVPGLWRRVADAGVTGLAVPERYGGAGADLTAAVPVLVELGRAGVPEPVVEALAGGAALAAAGGAAADEWLPRVVTGSAVIGAGLGPGELVAGAPWADLLVLRAGDEVHAVTADRVRVRPQPSLDKGTRAARVEWEPSGATRLGGADPDAVFDTGAVAAAAQLLGIADRLLEMTVAYAGTREHFGKPIGSFQAVKHQIADVYVATSFALPVVHRAAWSVSRGLASRARDASHAKLAATAAAERAARTALQVHGAIGYTYEHDLHIWMKRTWTLASLWGTPTWHRGRVASAVLSGSPPPRVP